MLQNCTLWSGDNSFSKPPDIRLVIIYSSLSWELHPTKFQINQNDDIVERMMVYTNMYMNQRSRVEKKKKQEREGKDTRENRKKISWQNVRKLNGPHQRILLISLSELLGHSG